VARNHNLGAWGEALAMAYLQARGYSILDRRWRTAGGELDLVARSGQDVVFVEVKTRGGRALAPAEDWVGPRQRQVLRRTARAWLAANDGAGGAVCRFDVIGVTLDEDGCGFRLRHLDAAF